MDDLTRSGEADGEPSLPDETSAPEPLAEGHVSDPVDERARRRRERRRGGARRHGGGGSGGRRGDPATARRDADDAELGRLVDRGRGEPVGVPVAQPGAGVEQHDRHGRRHGRARLGAALPDRPPAARPAGHGLDARLVRRVPGLRVLHGGPVAVRGVAGSRLGHVGGLHRGHRRRGRGADPADGRCGAGHPLVRCGASATAGSGPWSGSAPPSSPCCSCPSRTTSRSSWSPSPAW